MDPSKMSIPDAKSMSLDEYISASGINTKVQNKNDAKPDKSEAMETSETQIPNASSMQWRLLDPNRPVGMAPLIPMNAKRSSYNNDNNFKGVNRSGKGYFKKKNQNNAIVRFRKNAQNDMNSDASFVGRNGSQSLAVINNISQGIITMARTDNSFYQNLLTSIMENFVNKQKQEQQKYDMELQKDISKMQGKPFVYTCNSGQGQSVVSFDGPGLEDCEINVVTTNTTMNQRFA
ncbi:hypothetical protein Bhyg_09719 [Pseudolycoriella hygida]|uniref:Uncharacterized protein n=1 Tax=Pseudolycoriella hygida TaxID=35572 RepID=A0A9Q0RYJ8_9DIPT|nr:hypothetical protein Bhyg_09719 [Pseudolycoriella hygida]